MMVVKRKTFSVLVESLAFPMQRKAKFLFTLEFSDSSHETKSAELD